ncbi:MAG: hypothetical protein H6607_04745 [Flavobacteriales bacterium]|nr:hypothetical protein [Flavobacteriales bacterium]
MTVTRLERKARRNKTKAKERTAAIKRNIKRVYIKSPFKEESGIILDGDVFSIAQNLSTGTVAAAKPKKEAKGDDLTKVEGIGPKIAAALNAVGINTFAELAAKTSEEVKSILDAAEGNFAAHDPGTWPKQAEMAANGQWDELKVWQDELYGGK